MTFIWRTLYLAEQPWGEREKDKKGKVLVNDITKGTGLGDEGHLLWEKEYLYYSGELASLYMMNLNSRKWSWNKKEGAKESEELIPVESLLGLYDLEGI